MCEWAGEWMDGYALLTICYGLWYRWKARRRWQWWVVNVNVDCTMGGSARLMQIFLNCNTLGEVTVTLYIENGVYLLRLFLLFC